MSEEGENQNPNPVGAGNNTRLTAVKMPDRLCLGEGIEKKYKIFKQRWNTYSIIAELDKFSVDKQRAVFIHCLGDDALEAFNTFNLQDDASVSDIISAFDEFIIGESNETYERFLFNSRVQQEGEQFDLFCADLQRLIKSCNYCGDCEASILRDRIVLGIQDADVQRELLKIRKLNIEQTIDTCRANEKAKSQNKTLRPEINKVSTRRPVTTSFGKNKKGICKYCGYNHVFVQSKCPAFGKTCKLCKKKNHFAKCCKSNNNKTVHSVGNEYNCDSDGDSNDYEWINKLSDNESNINSKMIKCVMQVNKQLVKFQIDTGSSVNILPKAYIGVNPLMQTDIILKTWNNDNYKPLGECRVKVINPKNCKKYSVNFIVCEDQFTPIIGLSASKQMSLVKINENNFEVTNKIDVNKFSHVFDNNLGTFEGLHKFKLLDNAKPQIMPNRRVPIALNDKLELELNRLTKLGVIAPIDEPTEWVSQIVIVKKSDGGVRLCIDPQELNKVIVRERYTLPTLDDALHELSNSTVFSKTDLSSGYWHVQLDYDSSKLTTFQTTFGRYRWCRLPFGISTSAEIFQKKLNQALAGLKGVVCIADDIIIHGKNKIDHDENMNKFLMRCEQQNIKLNKNKTNLCVSSVTFMGHKITPAGLEVDEAKVRAVSQFATPENVSQLRSFLGMVNFLAKFIPNMSETLHPLHNLLKKDVQWNWSDSQESAFITIKNMIIKSVKLSIYDPKKELTIENDASEYGLGSVLLQDEKPLAFASRSLTESERNYAQIEKEMLAIVFGLKKFHHFTYGRDVNVITDHKPLTSIILKPLCKAPKRIQSLIMQIYDYDYKLKYKPGTEIPIADALSRSPVDISEQVNVMNNLDNTPLNETRFMQIKQETEKDPILVKLRFLIAAGWPTEKSECPPDIIPYFNIRDEMTIEDGVILRGERIVIPSTLRYDMKNKIHAGHLGINSCLRRARTHIYWPGMTSEIRQFVEQCSTCATFQPKQSSQPIHVRPLPDRAWKQLGVDLFTIKGRTYLITTDYYSQFFEIDYLKEDTSSSNVITKLKTHCARYGLPELIVSDNGPQFASRDFSTFCKSYGIKHSTISPGNSKSNGAVEAAVKIAKSLMIKSNHQHEDPYIALLNYRNTPQEGVEYSPVQRLMGRRTRTLIPTKPSLLQPETVKPNLLQAQRENKQVRMSERFIHKRYLNPLKLNESVRLQPIQQNVKIWKPATVTKQLNTHSYIVKTDEGREIRRNREQLRSSPSSPSTSKSHPSVSYKEPTTSENADSNHAPVTAQQNSPQIKHTTPSKPITTRSGRVIKKPLRYI